jgi:hypothetical protein
MEVGLGLKEDRIAFLMAQADLTLSYLNLHSFSHEDCGEIMASECC